MSIICRNKTHNKRTIVYRILLIGFFVVTVIASSSTAFLHNNLSSRIDSFAYGAPIDTAVSSLEDAQNKLAACQNEYNAAVNDANNLQLEIAEASKQAVEAQNEVLANQNVFNKICKYEYTSGSMPFLELVLFSPSFDQFVKNVDYANKIMEDKYKSLSEQAKKRDHFNDIIRQLNLKADQYNKAVDASQAKLSEINALVESAKATLSAAEAAEIERQAGGGTSGGGDDPSPQPDPGGEWQVGMASAYGGSSDPSSGHTTATGETVDDWSMGVAVPMSLPNYRQYFGHQILIKVGGTIVTAKVNDCGYMGGGSRALDLQPGVFKAFGYGSCQAWGVRQVEYRIL